MSMMLLYKVKRNWKVLNNIYSKNIFTRSQFRQEEFTQRYVGQLLDPKKTDTETRCDDISNELKPETIEHESTNIITGAIGLSEKKNGNQKKMLKIKQGKQQFGKRFCEQRRSLHLTFTKMDLNSKASEIESASEVTMMIKWKDIAQIINRLGMLIYLTGAIYIFFVYVYSIIPEPI